jgi:uncharacterized integral membrane protein
MSNAPGTSQASGGRSGFGRHRVGLSADWAGRARLVLAAALGGLAVAFALLNVEQVEVDWILGTWETPLIAVIVVSLLVGAVIGFTLARRRVRSAAGPTPSAHAGHGA